MASLSKITKAKRKNLVEKRLRRRQKALVKVFKQKEEMIEKVFGKK